MIEPFNRLVKLAARAFYDDITTKIENQPKNGRSDNRGIAVVVLDGLTRRQWVREEDLAKDLKLHTKQLRRTLRFFEEEKLITRDHRKETSKAAKIHNAAAAAAVGDSQHSGREGDEKQKMHTHSYCCLDYSQIYDVVRYRLHRMKKKLKDELESKDTIQEYMCPNCNKRYTALDALRLISPYDEYFHCESCNTILVAETDKLTVQDLGDRDDNARRRRNENLKAMLKKMEEQLKPLTDQLARVKDLPVPEFGSLQSWELRAKAAGRSANGDANSGDPSRSSHGLGGTPMPFVGETKVEVAFSGIDEKGEDIKTVSSSTPKKVLPPWMIKEGMNLTVDQRGETKLGEETSSSAAGGSDTKFDDKKSADAADEAKNIQDEYVKAYYAALLKLQREQEERAKKEEEERQVGMKWKREEEEDNEAAAAGVNSGETSNKRFNLNLEAEAEEEEEEEEDIDWEEG